MSTKHSLAGGSFDVHLKSSTGNRVSSSKQTGSVPPPVKSLSCKDIVGKFNSVSREVTEKHSNQLNPQQPNFRQNPVKPPKSAGIQKDSAFRVTNHSCEESDVAQLKAYQCDLNVSTTTLAQQISLVELELFKAIPAEELTSLKWTSKQKARITPNIMASTKWFNQICCWVQKSILSETDLTRRAAKLSKFIRVAKKLLHFNNYGSMMAVMAGLRMQSIYRLSETWAALSSKDRSKFKKISDLLSHDNNFHNLRSALEDARLPCIPYLGTYLTDLTYIDVVAKTAKEKDSESYDEQSTQDRINQVLSTIERFQQSEYNFSRDERIIHYLRAQRYVDELQGYIENAHYKISLKLEPNSRKETETLSDTEGKPSKHLQKGLGVSVAATRVLFESGIRGIKEKTLDSAGGQKRVLGRKKSFQGVFRKGQNPVTSPEDSSPMHKTKPRRRSNGHRVSDPQIHSDGGTGNSTSVMPVADLVPSTTNRLADGKAQNGTSRSSSKSIRERRRLSKPLSFEQPLGVHLTVSPRTSGSSSDTISSGIPICESTRASSATPRPRSAERRSQMLNPIKHAAYNQSARKLTRL